MDSPQTLQSFPPSSSPAPSANGTWIPAKMRFRFLARFIDKLILGVISIPLLGVSWYIFGFQPKGAAMFEQLGLNVVLGEIVTILFFGWFYLNKGGSPGKLLFNMRVVDSATGSNIGYGRVLVREVLGFWLDWFTLGIGLIMGIFRADKRALHDLVASTQVLKKSE